MQKRSRTAELKCIIYAFIFNNKLHNKVQIQDFKNFKNRISCKKIVYITGTKVMFRN